MQATSTRRSAIKRFNRKPKKHLQGTPMQLAVLEHLHDYRYSHTKQIKAALGSPQYLEDVLPDLVDYGYIGVPPFAVDRCARKKIPYVYELRERGAEFYASKRGPRARHTAGNWGEHDLLTCCHKFSFELAPRVIPELILRTPQAVLTHPDYPEAMKGNPTPFTIPTDPPLEYDLPLFGYDYRGKKIFGFVETDNNTHSLKDIKSKIDRSIEFLEERMAVTLFGMPSQLINFFYLTRNLTRMEDMADLVPKEYQSRFHFKWTGGFDTKLRPPRLTSF